MRDNERLLDAGIAAAVFAASLALRVGFASGDGHVEGLDAANVALTALASLPLLARRRAALAVFAITALASSGLSAGWGAAGPPLGPTLALYWVGTAGDGSRARNARDLGVAAVLLAVHAAAAGIYRDTFPGTELLFGTLVWGGAWLAGDRTRLRHERIAELEERARRAEADAERERRLAAAEERTRIARDLHDSAGHAINVILVHAGLGRMREEAEPGSARAELETIEQVARETVGEIDQMVGALREDGANGGGEVEPPPGLAALDGLVERHRAAGMDVTLIRSGDPRPIPSAVDRGSYRILQEALTNAARHGEGGATVEVAHEAGAVELYVSNPVSPAAETRPASGGHGLLGMRERASLLGGVLEAEVRGSRFEVHARLPAEEWTA